jgi:CRISPR-associated protein Cas2
MLLVTYDVSTESAAGKKRLSKVAKTCIHYGQRVQNSVFECHLDGAQRRKLEAELVKIINQEEDSLRFYNLGEHYHSKVTHIGIKPSINVDEALIV